MGTLTALSIDLRGSLVNARLSGTPLNDINQARRLLNSGTMDIAFTAYL
ncbi:hypothetical protein [Trinickia diaoshuihuensis]|jgi:hypothetical protein|nr:hypothetical protein [Trinickia diaoshuihuensis]